MVEYSIVLNRALHIWVVKPSGDIEFRSTRLDRSVYEAIDKSEEFTGWVANLRSSVTESRTNIAPSQLKDFYQLLIDPIADLLPSDPNAKVVFVPQGSLFLVPFPALQDEEDTYLIEKHTILTAPSIQVLKLAASESDSPHTSELPTGDRALIVGNPVMPVVSDREDGSGGKQLPALQGTKKEAQQIAALLNASPLLGDQATESTIKQRLPAAQLIHLATHGLLDYERPDLGGFDVPGAIALTPGNGEDGLLTSFEIANMRLNADLAVLSACDTGRGRITGDGVIGLSRSLITSGVPSVVVSLWQVDDDATAELMENFYSNLYDHRLDKAQALRQAMLTLLQGDFPSPKHWSAFTLIGESG